jgi:hypothetical protein
MNHDRLQHTSIIGPNFFPDALFQLLKCAKFVLLQFGFQVSQEKAVRRREVRIPGWPGDGTKTWYDVSRKDGSHTVQWSARIVQCRVDFRVTVHLPSSEEWGPVISKSDTPHQTKWRLFEHAVWLIIAPVSAVLFTDLTGEMKICLDRHNASAPGRPQRRRYY